ncbi:transcriptional repressor NrdR [Candidatus Woesearchaeota archaeon]|nr:transcriptional repressor NrdR [Candidatus Woesearchaeota archaeon]
MKCPYCSNVESKVVDKRNNDTDSTIRRRRECLKCEKRYTTYERIETDLMIIKKDERREPYNREKLKIGIQKSCEKRPINQEQIEKMIDDIENVLREQSTAEIKSNLIGQLVMKYLKKLDKVAFVRFASVYKEFDDPEDFIKTIRDVK